MHIIQIIIIAIIQGMTEFLPISSSGHLVLLPKIFTWQDHGHLIEVIVHIGTLLAVIAYFWRDVTAMFWGACALLQGKITNGGKMFLMLALGTIPAVIFGLFLKIYGIDSVRTTLVIGYTMTGYAIILYIADQFKPYKNINSISVANVILIGIAQALALIPGTSRSGACITMTRLLGFNRSDATRFSFLLSIPAIIAAGTLTLINAYQDGSILHIYHEALTAGILSFIAGLCAIHFMVKWVKTHNMNIFVGYRLVLGIIIIAYAHSNY